MSERAANSAHALAWMRSGLDASPSQAPTPALHLPDPPPLTVRTLSVRTPGSKSVTNRALLLAGLAHGITTLEGALTDADDAQRMILALVQLGASVTQRGNTLIIIGAGGRWAPTRSLGSPASAPCTLNLQNAGTATRFLAASVLASPCPLTIDGNSRMRERPIGELTDVLRALGVGVTFLGKAGYPPVTLTPPPASDALPLAASLGRTQSGQFISALLLVAPFLAKGLTLRLTGPITSESYVRMTLGLLSELGASVQTAANLSTIRVTAGSGPSALPRAFELSVEPDASSATYFAAAAALLPGTTVRLEGLSARSLQGDAAFPQVLSRMGVPVSMLDDAIVVGSATWDGVLQPILADMSDMPDAAMTLASVAAFAPGTSILRGLRTLRVKETDRIAALQTELGKLGVVVKTNVQGDDGAVTITPPAAVPSVEAPLEFATYDDHRMAMSLALIGLRRQGIIIQDPACVRKTYATFWRDWASLWDV